MLAATRAVVVLVSISMLGRLLRWCEGSWVSMDGICGGGGVEDEEDEDAA